STWRVGDEEIDASARMLDHDLTDCLGVLLPRLGLAGSRLQARRQTRSPAARARRDYRVLASEALHLDDTAGVCTAWPAARRQPLHVSRNGQDYLLPTVGVHRGVDLNAEVLYSSSVAGRAVASFRASSKSSRLAVYLRLGRISNLPTVWTNVLAGALLTGQPL